MKFSLNDVIIKAAALTLRSVSTVNSTYRDGVAKQQPTVDISVAVATPGGLITPIVFAADQQSVRAIASKVAVSASLVGSVSCEQLSDVVFLARS